MADTMLNDKRPVESLWNEHDHRVASVGASGVTRIEVYREYGQSGYVPAIAVWRGDFLAWRMLLPPGWAVCYARPEEGESDG